MAQVNIIIVSEPDWRGLRQFAQAIAALEATKVRISDARRVR